MRNFLLLAILALSAPASAIERRSGGSGGSGGSSGVTAPGNGTAGKIPVWTGSLTLGDSNWTENGGNLTSTGSITAATGTFTLSVNSPNYLVSGSSFNTVNGLVRTSANQVQLTTTADWTIGNVGFQTTGGYMTLGRLSGANGGSNTFSSGAGDVGGNGGSTTVQSADDGGSTGSKAVLTLTGGSTAGGGTGGSSTLASGNASGTGGNITLAAGNSGGSNTGGTAGLTGGNGGGSGGSGGSLSIRGGNGGGGSGVGGDSTYAAGAGNSGAKGGDTYLQSGESSADKGDIYFRGGNANRGFMNGDSGKFGIGTVTPTEKLQVIGRVDISSGVQASSGTFSGAISAATGTFNYVQAATVNVTNSEYQVGGVAVITSSRAIIGTSGTFTGVVTAASFSGSASGLTGFPNTVVCQSGAGAASVLCQGVGGAANSAGGTGATVSGGTGNSASVTSSKVGGGTGNTVSGVEGTIGGGSLNDVQGNGGMIPGGVSNSAIGSTSFAAGNRAKSNANGCFTWADSQAVDFPCNTVDSFRARAAGEMYFETPRATFTGVVRAANLELPAGSTLAVSGVFTISTAPTAGTAVSNFNIDQFGNVNFPTQPKVRGGKDTAQALISNTITAIFFSTESYDNKNMHSIVTSSDTFTIPAGGDGDYFINCVLSFAANAVGERGIFISVNGTNNWRAAILAAPSGNTALALSDVYPFVGGDVLKCLGRQISGASLNVSAGESFFSIRRVP